MASSLDILRPTPSTRSPYSAQTSLVAKELENRSLRIIRSNSTSYLAPDFQVGDVPHGEHGEVLRVSADVDEERSKAKVWLLLSARQESIMVLSWRIEREGWRCYRQVGMGFEGFRI